MVNRYGGLAYIWLIDMVNVDKLVVDNLNVVRGMVRWVSGLYVDGGEEAPWWLVNG